LDFRKFSFGSIEIDGLTYEHDVVIDRGKIRKRKKKAFATIRLRFRRLLEQLPKQFKASDIRKVRAAKDKRSLEFYAAITRWMEAGSVKRRDRGIYERVK
jgi:hypothetical protein